MAIGHSQLFSHPAEGSSLPPDRLSQFTCCNVPIHETQLLGATSIVLAATLRKHHCYMTNELVRDRTFGAWLERQLARREWSKADLARRMGVANGDVSRWARDERTPSPVTIDKMADVLSVDVDFLLTLAGHRPQVIEIDPDSPTARLMPLIERVNWDAYPGRLDTLEKELQWMIERDREAESGKE